MPGQKAIPNSLECIFSAIISVALASCSVSYSTQSLTMTDPETGEKGSDNSIQFDTIVTDTELTPGTEEDSQAGIDGDADSDGDIDSNSDIDTHSDSSAYTDTDSDSYSDGDTDTDSDVDTDADADSDTDVDSDADTDTDADADADADADSDSDSDTDTDIDVNLPPLSLLKSGADIDETVTIEAEREFRLVFEAGDNWGIAQWYDLVNDPEATNNLVDSTFDNPAAQENGLFQMVWYGTDPNDPKLYMRAAKYSHPDADRSFSVLEDTPMRVVVEAISHPLLIAGVLDNLTVSVRYYIYPNGKLFIVSKTTAQNTQSATEWRSSVLGLNDPQNSQSNCPDTAGWIRASATQNPYEWAKGAEKYIFAYWSPATPAPYESWTNASVMLVPIGVQGENTFMVSQACHGWNAFKRWYYTGTNVSMSQNETITHRYLLQLGSKGSSVLPDLTSSTICDPIANAYLSNPTPPGTLIPE